jgi:hypothetical protein
MPQQGYLPTAREAAAATKDYYERLLRFNEIANQQAKDAAKGCVFTGKFE